MFVDASKGGLEIKIDAAVLYGALQYIELNLVFLQTKDTLTKWSTIALQY